MFAELKLKLNIPSDNTWYWISYHISLSHLSLSFFLPATDSDDGEADRINRSQSAPDEDEHGPFLPFLTVYFKVKSGNPSYLISLLILSLLLSPSYTFTSFNAPVSFFFFFFFFCASAKWQVSESPVYEMLWDNVFYFLDPIQFFSYHVKCRDRCHQKTTSFVHSGLWGVSEKWPR